MYVYIRTCLDIFVFLHEAFSIGNSSRFVSPHVSLKQATTGLHAVRLVFLGRTRGANSCRSIGWCVIFETVSCQRRYVSLSCLFVYSPIWRYEWSVNPFGNWQTLLFSVVFVFGWTQGAYRKLSLNYHPDSWLQSCQLVATQLAAITSASRVMKWKNRLMSPSLCKVILFLTYWQHMSTWWFLWGTIFGVFNLG